jgi:hypothetical protein
MAELDSWFRSPQRGSNGNTCLRILIHPGYECPTNLGFTLKESSLDRLRIQKLVRSDKVFQGHKS